MKGIHQQRVSSTYARLTKGCVAPFQDVIDFHKKFQIDYDGPPREIDEQHKYFRTKRLNEEFEEYLQAIDKKNLEGQLDALVDLVYIALGTMRAHGWDFDEAWSRVHDANMRKELASSTNPGKYSDRRDIVKPPGWSPPSHKDLVEVAS